LAALINPRGVSAEGQAKQLQQAARTLGVQQLEILHASTDQEIESAFETLVQRRAGGLVIGADPFFLAAGRTKQLAALALRHGVPAIDGNLDFAPAGGLMSYGGSLTQTHHLAGVYTARILHGEKPADLPVQMSTRIELIINQKTARSFPLTILGRADEVIEVGAIGEGREFIAGLLAPGCGRWRFVPKGKTCRWWDIFTPGSAPQGLVPFRAGLREAGFVHLPSSDLNVTCGILRSFCFRPPMDRHLNAKSLYRAFSLWPRYCEPSTVK
jgi:hypothetical protein